MEEVYVQRDEFGALKGVYRNPQPQEDGTWLTEKKPVSAKDAEVQAFMEALETPTPGKDLFARLAELEAEVAKLKA